MSSEGGWAAAYRTIKQMTAEEMRLSMVYLAARRRGEAAAWVEPAGLQAVVGLLMEAGESEAASYGRAEAAIEELRTVRGRRRICEG